MSSYKETTFRELLVDALFYVWADSIFATRSLDWIECIKLDENTAQEIYGVCFHISPDHEVVIFLNDDI